MVEITKDTAMFIRRRLPDACIRKTMQGHTSERGKYYVEGSNAVLKLISEYQQTEKIIEEYPTRK